MPAAIRIVLNAEEDRTLLELSCADGVPYRTKQRAIAIIEGIKNRSLQGQYQVERFIFN
ncbi:MULTISPECIES: hypothetical protein [unclassified Nostoc]|uniref:hypothetical protein n=1 Tax=unclassified Nostoc TaxID=2593658 RepID=UPI002AD30A5D|nr:hypothetical protein [Nostoc sp. DedQUE03]MDZ7975577.1 hypothetical protein [Nostoc sp. DedQUE03]MDZ8048778.1 hypothetical protein [Nostoc sp. DedQUE02]